MEEREMNERKTGGLMGKVQELFVQLGVTLGTDFGQVHSSAFEKLTTRVSVDLISVAFERTIS